MKLAQAYRRSWRSKVFLFIALAAILFIGVEQFQLYILVGSYLGNIPVKFESLAKGFGEDSI